MILRWIGSMLIGLGALAGIAQLYAQPITQASGGHQIVVAELRGTINPATLSFLKTTIQRVEREHDEALIVELDTPGGLVSSVREMAQAIDQSKVPVVVYVTPAGASATSAGALLTMAAHVAVMAPGTNIGAAHPVGNQGEDIKGDMAQKAVNDVSAFARGLAEIRGRNRDLAEAIVTKSRSLTAQEALKEKVIDLIAVDRKELLEKLNNREVTLGRDLKTRIQTTGASVQMAEMGVGQKLLHLLANPNIATLLMTIGMLLLYVELSNPGIGVAGALGGVCLLTAFIAFQLLPIRMGALALIGLGVLMFVIEPFVTSHGAVAAGGLVAFVLGILWIFDPSETTLRVDPAVWVPAVLTLGLGVAALIVFTIRNRRLIHETLAIIGGSGAAGLSGYKGHVESVSKDGLQGKALIRGETWDVSSEVPLRVGDSVEVIAIRGMQVSVKPLSK